MFDLMKEIGLAPKIRHSQILSVRNITGIGVGEERYTPCSSWGSMVCSPSAALLKAPKAPRDHSDHLLNKYMPRMQKRAAQLYVKMLNYVIPGAVHSAEKQPLIRTNCSEAKMVSMRVIRKPHEF